MFATRTSTMLIGARLAPPRLDRVLIAGVGLLLFSFPVMADEELGQRASWSNPQAAEVKAELDKWLATQQLEELSRLKIDALWPENAAPAAGLESLCRFAESVGVVDPRVAELVANCQSSKAIAVPKSDVLQDEKLAPAVRNNLRLLFGRWLAQRELYDEASEQLAGLKPAEVVDPASLLFYQGVVSHRLLKKDECLAAIDKLMENEDEIPRRYSVVARLMEADIRPLKQDSLDEVARMMDEIKRRLALGRAGERVRTQEDQVVAKLEKMIEELEKGRGGPKTPGAGNNPSSPLPDSVPAGGSGPGDVDPRRLTQGTNWGNLPQKERDEVLQQISKELPAHYREVIKEYFRKIARE